PPVQGTSPRADRRLEAIDRAIELRDGADAVAVERSSGVERPVAVSWRWRYAAPDPIAHVTIPRRPHRPGTAGAPARQAQESGQAPTEPDGERRFRLSASLALAVSVAGAIRVHSADRGARRRTCPTGPCGWPTPRRHGRDARTQTG